MAEFDSVKITLDYKAIGEILKTQTQGLVNDWAKKVAATIPGAELEEYTTDRQAAKVRVPAHQQAKDGALTRAAAGLGLVINQK